MSQINRIVSFLLRHKEFAVNVLSASYPFTKQELKRYKDKLNWEWVCVNENIIWSESLYKEFEDKISLEDLSYNNAFPWTEDFIDDHLIDLFYAVNPQLDVTESGLSYNTGLPWSEDFIKKYEVYWNWIDLSGNDSIPFTIELIEKFRDKWDYDILEFNSAIKRNPELRTYLNIFYNLNSLEERIHSCEFCTKGDEILIEYKGKPISTAFFDCPNFSWADDFASRMRGIMTDENKVRLVADKIQRGDFRHWSIDVLEAFEEYWDYDFLHYADSLTEYIAKTIKSSDRISHAILLL